MGEWPCETSSTAPTIGYCRRDVSLVSGPKFSSTNLHFFSAIKEYLGKYRGVDADNNEGYDGHQKWHENDQVVRRTLSDFTGQIDKFQVLQAMAYFYKAVKSKLYSEVRSFLGILLPHGPDDGRLSSLQSLLMDTSSEESLKVRQRLKDR